MYSIFDKMFQLHRTSNFNDKTFPVNLKLINLFVATTFKRNENDNLQLKFYASVNIVF